MLQGLFFGVYGCRVLYCVQLFVMQYCFFCMITSMGSFDLSETKMTNINYKGGRSGSVNFPLRKTQAKNTQNCLKAFKDKLILSIFRGVGVFSPELNFSASTLDHLATTRRPVSYRIRFTTCRSILANKIFFH